MTSHVSIVSADIVSDRGAAVELDCLKSRKASRVKAVRTTETQYHARKRVATSNDSCSTRTALIEGAEQAESTCPPSAGVVQLKTLTYPGVAGLLAATVISS
jgi:predicted dinucleotide-utilizing enzyme